MLFGRTAFSLPAVGAIITVLSLAFDPFVQQILSTYVQQVPRASPLAVTTQATSFLQPQSLLLQQAISNAVYTDKFDRTPGCPSGNCSFPDFRSLGWCSKCQDVTREVQSNCSYSYNASTLVPGSHTYGQCDLGLGQGYATTLLWEVAPVGNTSFGFQVTTEALWLVDDGNAMANATFVNPTYSGIDSPQAVLGHVRMAFDDDAFPEKGFHVANATQCVLSYCVRDYQVSVESGALSVNQSGPNFGKVYTRDDVNMACWTADPDAIAEMKYTNITTSLSFPTQQGTIDFTNEVDPEHFAFCSSRAINGIQGLAVALGGYGASIGNPISGSSQSGVAFSEAGVQETDYFGATAGASADVFTYLSTTSTLGDVTNRLADALTALALTLPNKTQAITGSVSNPEVFVQVRWEWISLPIALCVGGAVFLAFTAFSTRMSGVGLWKGSSLAYLYHGLDERPGSFEGFDTASSMQASAESTMVSLRFSDKTARVCLT
jgi:hypothetical protein